MIRSLRQLSDLARENGPRTVAVLAPENEEFMAAVKEAHKQGFIDPLLIGDSKKMQQMAEKVEFDIAHFEIIPLHDKQQISDFGIQRLFSGGSSFASKGQIPTSFIYKSIIREEAKAKSGLTVSVICFWEIPEIDHLIALTDTGVNIAPDVKAKEEILKNAVAVCRFLGYEKPKIAVLSAQRGIGGELQSFRDYKKLRENAARGVFGACEILEATSFSEIFLQDTQRKVNTAGMPHILLVPSLDAGNIICKLDFFLNMKRSALVASSHGPVCIPSRSDDCEKIVNQLAMCVMLADMRISYDVVE
ncbi:MAG: phosphate acyltransferase [Syntrophales bacterium]|nr:phosphate acyltransferase [Syntrophales bacterium]MDY0043443.1 phosphate acyltransferase [Syntrophales bacterium]